MSKRKLAKEVKEKEEEKEPRKAEKLSAFLQAYKLQNPVKYEAKRARGELKGL